MEIAKSLERASSYTRLTFSSKNRTLVNVEIFYQRSLNRIAGIMIFLCVCVIELGGNIHCVERKEKASILGVSVCALCVCRAQKLPVGLGNHFFCLLFPCQSPPARAAEPLPATLKFDEYGFFLCFTESFCVCFHVN
jgi:hypothetical protein